MAERRKGGATWFVRDREGFEKEVDRLTGGKEGELGTFSWQRWGLMIG